MGTCETFKINNGSGLITCRAYRVADGLCVVFGIRNNHIFKITHITEISLIKLQV
jgi:hypothetical protein